ncbi:MAG: PAS domain S-box protein [Balneolales bacterium]
MDILEVMAILRTHAKNEESVEELKDLFENIIEEKERAVKDLYLLEAAIRNDYDAILITELELEKPGPKIVYVNEGFERMTGYSRQEVIGKTPRILQGPKTDNKTLARLKESLSNGKAFFGQTVNYRKDGSEFINRWDVHPLINEDGKITHWVSYQQDIYERKRLEQSLIDSKAEADDLYEWSKLMKLDIARDGSVYSANKALQELVGFEKEELLRMKVWEIMPEKHGNILRKRFDELWKENFATQNSYRLIFQHKSGVPVQVEATIHPIELKRERVVRMEISNFSLRKRVLKTLNQRNRDFHRLFNTRSDFKYCLNINEQGEPGFRWISGDIQNITGYTPAECEGCEGWKKLIHPEDQKKVMVHLKKAAEGKSMCTEYRIIDKEGQEIQVMDYSRDADINKFDIKGAVALVNQHWQDAQYK